jgi:uncharacterized protein YkwD
MSPNLIDALLALILLVGAWTGWRRGFLYSALDLLTLVASLVLAYVGYRYPARWLEAVLPQLGVWTDPLSFVVLFFLLHFLLGAVAMRFAHAVPAGAHANVGNRLLGLAPGLVNGAIHAAVIAVVLLTVPLGPVSLWARESPVAARLSAPAEWLETRLAPIFDPAIRRTMQALMVQPESRTSIKLRWTVARPAVRTDLEARMLDMVNAERAKAGLKPVRADPELAAVARAHSQDMFARGYFSHYTPEGRDLQDRLRQARIGFLTAGENLALAPTLAGAHQGLMKSPGHRANILRPQFGRVGIGILDGGVHGLMVTQNFRN